MWKGGRLAGTDEKSNMKVILGHLMRSSRSHGVSFKPLLCGLGGQDASLPATHTHTHTHNPSQTDLQRSNPSVGLTAAGGAGMTTASFKPLFPERVSQFIKFCLVGGSGTLVDMGVLFVLADPRTLALNIAFSKVCAAEVALVNNFLWNELWTFRSPNFLPPSDGETARVRGFHFGSPRLRRFLFFNAICGLGIVFAVCLLHLFHNLLGWNLYLSNLLTIGLVTLWNFGMNARFNWKQRAD